MDHPQAAQVAFGRGQVARPGFLPPLGVVVMIAGHHGEGQGVSDQPIGLGGGGDLDRLHALGPAFGVHAGGQRPGAEPARGVVGVDGDCRMLPDVAQGCGEDNVAAARGRAICDEAHLLAQHVARIEREALGALMREVDIVLSVGDHRDGEAAAVGGFAQGRGGGE